MKTLSIRLDDDTVKLIEDWRSKQRPIPNFNQAVNTMLKGEQRTTKEILTEIFSIGVKYYSHARMAGVSDEKLKDLTDFLDAIKVIIVNEEVTD